MSLIELLETGYGEVFDATAAVAHFFFDSWGSYALFYIALSGFVVFWCYRDRFEDWWNSHNTEVDPEVCNFVPNPLSYHRPNYETKKLCVTTFANELVLGDVQIRQCRHIHNDNIVYLEVSDPDEGFWDLGFCIPGDPHLPLDLAETMNDFFESRSHSFSFVDFEHFELTLTRQGPNSFSLKHALKEKKEWVPVLHFHDLTQACC